MTCSFEVSIKLKFNNKMDYTLRVICILLFFTIVLVKPTVSITIVLEETRGQPLRHSDVWQKHKHHKGSKYKGAPWTKYSNIRDQ